MADSVWAVVDPVARKIWSERFFRDIVPMTYFSRFMGRDENSMVLVNEELTAINGDRVRFGMWKELPDDSGVTSNKTLKGNETKIDTFTFDVVLEEFANAVTSKNPLDRKRIMFDYDNMSLNSLKLWAARHIDLRLFEKMRASPTKTFFAGSATTEAGLTASDTFAPELVSRAVTFARTGGNGTQPIIRPVLINGQAYHVALLHDDALHDLSLNATWAQAAREALQRSPDNPIFSGAEYLWNGTIIHAHRNIVITTVGSVPISRNFLLGANALVWAWGERPRLVKATDDFEREVGYSAQYIGEAGKPVFDGKDYAVIAMTSARTKISDG